MNDERRPVVGTGGSSGNSGGLLFHDDTYPHPIYPGFTDPADYRESSRVPDNWREEPHLKVAQVVDDARDDHVAKHTTYDHPWCSRRWVRADQWERVHDGFSPALTNAELHQLRQGLLDMGLSIADVRRAENGPYGETFEQAVERSGIPAGPIADAAVHYLEEADRTRFMLLSAESETYSRAFRWFSLHRDPPKDTFDPEAEDAFTALDAEYLDVDEPDELPTPEPLIEGVLTRHAYALLTGRDGTWKSFTALDWSLCLASGKPWQTRQAEHVRVLYVAGEGAYGLAARLKAWEYAWQTSVEPDWFTVRKSSVNLFKGGPAFDHLLAKVSEGGYGLVVVDTLRRASGGAQENGSDMGLVVDRLERLKRATLNGSVLVVAHTGKEDKDARGYSGIEDDADIVWKAVRDEGRLTLKNAKMKDGPDGLQVLLEPHQVLDSLILQSATEVSAWAVDTSEAERHLVAVLVEHFANTPATTSALREVSGLPKTSFYRALGKLIERGTAVNVGTKRAALYEPASHLLSQVVPTLSTPADLRLSQQSQAVPTSAQSVPPSPTPPRGGTWDWERDPIPSRALVLTSSTSERRPA